MVENLPSTLAFSALTLVSLAFGTVLTLVDVSVAVVPGRESKSLLRRDKHVIVEAPGHDIDQSLHVRRVVAVVGDERL